MKCETQTFTDILETFSPSNSGTAARSKYSFIPVIHKAPLQNEQHTGIIQVPNSKRAQLSFLKSVKIDRSPDRSFPGFFFLVSCCAFLPASFCVPRKITYESEY